MCKHSANYTFVNILHKEKLKIFLLKNNISKRSSVLKMYIKVMEIRMRIEAPNIGIKGQRTPTYITLLPRSGTVSSTLLYKRVSSRLRIYFLKQYKLIMIHLKFHSEIFNVNFSRIP